MTSRCNRITGRGSQQNGAFNDKVLQLCFQLCCDGVRLNYLPNYFAPDHQSWHAQVRPSNFAKIRFSFTTTIEFHLASLIDSYAMDKNPNLRTDLTLFAHFIELMIYRRSISRELYLDRHTHIFYELKEIICQTALQIARRRPNMNIAARHIVRYLRITEGDPHPWNARPSSGMHRNISHDVYAHSIRFGKKNNITRRMVFKLASQGAKAA